MNYEQVTAALNALGKHNPSHPGTGTDGRYHAWNFPLGEVVLYRNTTGDWRITSHLHGEVFPGQNDQVGGFGLGVALERVAKLHRYFNLPGNNALVLDVKTDDEEDDPHWDVVATFYPEDGYPGTGGWSTIVTRDPMVVQWAIDVIQGKEPPGPLADFVQENALD